MNFIYLAAPYTAPDAATRDRRFEQTNAYAARLMSAGYAVFSPISQSHLIATHLPPALLLDHGFWMAVDLPILRHAAALFVLALPGWQESRGVTAEVDFARRHGITTVMLHEPHGEIPSPYSWLPAREH